MDEKIQDRAFIIIKNALEKKKFVDAMQYLRTCVLSISQYNELKTIAGHVGCSIEIISILNDKIAIQQRKFFYTKNSNGKIYTDHKLETDNSKSPQNHFSIQSNKRAKVKEIIGYSINHLRFCVCDSTRLKCVSVSLGSFGRVPGFICPYCNRTYVHYGLLGKVKNQKNQKEIKIIDFQDLKNKNVRKTSEKTSPSTSNTLILPSKKPELVYLATNIPKKCICGNTKFTDSPCLPYPISEYKFKGFICDKCSAKYILKKTYDNLSIEAKKSLLLQDITWLNIDIDSKTQKGESSNDIKNELWWKRTLAKADSENEPFTLMQGKGKQDINIVFGIDFGASTTKIVVQARLGKNAPTIRALSCENAFACESFSNNFLILSQVQMIQGEMIAMCGVGYPTAEVRPYFKGILVNEKYIDSDPDEIYFAIFFLANILKVCEKYLHSAFPPNAYRKASVKIAFGMPVSHTMSDLSNLFTSIFSVADALKREPNIDSFTGYNFVQWKELCIDTGKHLIGRKPYLDVRPEIYAEVMPIFQSNSNSLRRAIVVDVGSSTIDIAYVFTLKPVQEYIYIPIADVMPLGVEVVAASIVVQSKSDYPSLESARDALFMGTLPKTITQTVEDSVKLMLEFCLSRVQIIEAIEFEHALVKPEIPIYFYGGGSRAVWYKRFIDKSIKSYSKELKFVMPLSDLKNIPRVPDHLQHRYQVVLGLTTQDESMPLRATPIDFEQYWTMESQQDKKVPINLEELQANLYGK
ncbi:hypothetical protein SAMN06298221_1196 [Sphaerochaeta associata]|uniref:hypothetical protein n=1 Tax=Sphaerochaeta associata TaxID=1129264 RepID=UPI000DFE13A5|nr:hypothetical protein [Sphaerochaeta associata]SMP65332.1 hypothetical protein SAMN06298221_1196 [Sphaerochaeta associata]